MTDEARYTVASDTDIVVVRQAGRQLASELGFSAGDLIMIATAISELARNIVEYARSGEIVLSKLEQGGRRGLRVIATDAGPGIPDIARAMQDGYSTSNSLGLGLPGTRRLMDEFEIDSEVGVGTRITTTKWVAR
jgi:serine/threonine-protein kinase RsbT